MKLVREKLFEIKRNQEGSGLGAIGIGKRSIIKDWLIEGGITNYSFGENDVININGDINFSELAFNVGKNYPFHMEAFPDFIQFGTINGSFNISNCGLLHLKGSPYKVNGHFICNDNELSSLDFCPKFVRGDFVCYNNFAKFKKSDVTSKCQVLKGIYNEEEEYVDGSVEYNRQFKNT